MAPDPTFFPSPREATKSPPEELAYVALVDPSRRRPDAVGVVDVLPGSTTYGRLVRQVELTAPGDELHHLGWNACSSCLCPYAPNPHLQRRYLLAPGLSSSRIHVIDTGPDPSRPAVVKVIEPGELIDRTGYAMPYTTHCGPDGIYLSALGTGGGDAPGGIFTLDHDSFELRGAWELERGPQRLSCDFGWHLGQNTLVTSEWGTPDMVQRGLDPERLLAASYGHSLHVWDLRGRCHRKELDLGAEQQMVLGVRPAHDPSRPYGYAGVMLSLADLSSSVWIWYRDRGGTEQWRARKVIGIPAEPAGPEQLPPVLRGFNAVPPLVTDLNLSLDDRQLYVSCWATGELRQYDVSSPFEPRLTATVRLGGVLDRGSHPSRPQVPLDGGPQRVEISRDGRRIYLTNSFHAAWDNQVYTDGIKGWMVRITASPEGDMTLDPRFFVALPDGLRGKQVRLQGGDASSDSFCYA